jgi:GTPase SAR1 family protein
MASSNSNITKQNSDSSYVTKYGIEKQYDLSAHENNQPDCADNDLFCSKDWCSKALVKSVLVPTESANLVDSIQSMIDKIALTNAETYKLTPSVIIHQLPPVDILIFGRSGVGKSALIKAITGIQVPSSPDIDHVTQTINCTIVNNGKLKFRFWDTKGIDKWENYSDVENMFNEIKEKKIMPLFVIYCASFNGRVNSKIVTKILLNFKQYNVPIAYVITNIYAGDDNQFDGQRKGAFSIMNDVFLVQPEKISEYYYEYGELRDTDGELISDGKGILICVNSQPYIKKRENIDLPQFNINELLDFIGCHLNGERFAEFVILTLNNRSYWKQKYDYLLSRLAEISTYLYQYGMKLTKIKSVFK